ncbi:hypothetical protein [Nocardiopsis sp. NPDC058789]|uniref:hypothetical protein n=1 Tax=Nocardiopsis sp. NPDC058789 TaxID=3346634 RepID=UPI003672A6A1
MFATVAAVLFGIAVLFEILGLNIEGIVTTTTLALTGLLFLALHLAGFGSSSPRRRC